MKERNNTEREESYMPNNQEAIENAAASIKMEGFNVTEQDKQWCEKLLNKEITFDDYLAYALKKTGITE